MIRSRALIPATLGVLAASLFATAPAHAAPGDLDPSFSGDGKQTTDVVFDGGEAAFDVAVQADGKIVAVGGGGSGFALARYDPDGTLDTSFSGDGKQTTRSSQPCRREQRATREVRLTHHAISPPSPPDRRRA